MYFVPQISKRTRIAVAVVALCATILFTYTWLKAPFAASDTGSRSEPNRVSKPIDPSLDARRLAQSEGLLYGAPGRNIFGIQQTQQTTKIHQPPATPTPVPPVIVMQTEVSSLKFYGFAKRHDQAKQVFLADGAEIFIGREGEVVDRHYKILRVADNSIELEDLLNNNHLVLKLVLQRQS